jgi:hypothetical protein
MGIEEAIEGNRVLSGDLDRSELYGFPDGRKSLVNGEGDFHLIHDPPGGLDLQAREFP